VSKGPAKRSKTVGFNNAGLFSWTMFDQHFVILDERLSSVKHLALANYKRNDNVVRQ
jgi:hypothetical protein